MIFAWRTAAIGGALLALATAGCGSEQPPAEADVDVTAAPSVLQAGDTATVQARADGVATCRLRLETAESSYVELSGRAVIRWTWQVPEAPGTGPWDGDVECWDGRAQGEEQDNESFSGTVRGGRGDPAPIAEGTLSAAVTELEGDPRPSVERWSDWAQILTAALGIPTLLTIGFTLILTRHQMRAERTSQILERYQTTKFRATLSQVMRYLDAMDEAACVGRIRDWEAAKTSQDDLMSAAGGKPVNMGVLAEALLQRLDKRDADPTSRSVVMSAVDFYEEIGALYMRHEVDRKLVQRSFGSTVVQALEASWWWLQYQREGNAVAVRPQHIRAGETELYSEWQRMARLIVRRRPKLEAEELNRKGRDDRVRAICLPAKVNDPSDATWEACASLSTAVAKAVCTHSLEHVAAELAARQDRGDAPDDEERSRTLLVPKLRAKGRDSATFRPRWWPVQRMAEWGARLDEANEGYGILRMTPSPLRKLGKRVAKWDRRAVAHARHREAAFEIQRLRADLGDAEAEKFLATLPPQGC